MRLARASLIWDHSPLPTQHYHTILPNARRRLHGSTLQLKIPRMAALRTSSPSFRLHSSALRTSNAEAKRNLFPNSITPCSRISISTTFAKQTPASDQKILQTNVSIRLIFMLDNFSFLEFASTIGSACRRFQQQ